MNMRGLMDEHAQQRVICMSLVHPPHTKPRKACVVANTLNSACPIDRAMPPCAHLFGSYLTMPCTWRHPFAEVRMKETLRAQRYFSRGFFCFTSSARAQKPTPSVHTRYFWLNRRRFAPQTAGP